MCPLDGVSQKFNTVAINDNSINHRRACDYKSSKESASFVRLPDDNVTLSSNCIDNKAHINSNSASNNNTKPQNFDSKTTLNGKNTDDPQIQQQIARLKQVEAKVKAHEAAHQAAGGNLASSASYSYTQGPDGKSYVTGGEVQIDLSEGQTAEETITRMQQVIRAALAPTDPSGQDRAVAAEAANRMAQAQQEKLQADSTAKTNLLSTSSGLQTVKQAYNIDGLQSESNSGWSNWA